MSVGEATLGDRVQEDPGHIAWGDEHRGPPRIRTLDTTPNPALTADAAAVIPISLSLELRPWPFRRAMTRPARHPISTEIPCTRRQR